MEELKDNIVGIVDHYLRFHDLMTGEEAADKILSLMEKTEPVAEVPCSDRVMREFTQGVCGDGAAIICDGEQLTIEEILILLRVGENYRMQLQKASA